jgi:hypothetical protein
MQDDIKPPPPESQPPETDSTAGSAGPGGANKQAASDPMQRNTAEVSATEDINPNQEQAQQVPDRIRQVQKVQRPTAGHNEHHIIPIILAIIILIFLAAVAIIAGAQKADDGQPAINLPGFY